MCGILFFYVGLFVNFSVRWVVLVLLLVISYYRLLLCVVENMSCVFWYVRCVCRIWLICVCFLLCCGMFFMCVRIV